MNTQVLHEVSPMDLPQRVRNTIAKDRDDYEESATSLKEAINNFLWVHLPADTVIRDAEKKACIIFAVMMDVGVDVHIRGEGLAKAEIESIT